ncbi:MAG: UvrD-helicase domain-containing protein, partial [Chloroflexi bacterium]|nr:UvrD-helicase domain-containing protein [Chloroflexota bacterium]
EHYDRTLRARGGLDFDDLIWRAIDALEQDPSFAANLRQRWPYILEDEAQDSSPLQESILRLLCGADGHWVRMGDPNQAINATFTAADPRFFRRFLEEPRVRRMTLPESGRCARPILEMANALVRWASREHPEWAIREMAFEPQEIIPTTPEDPQQNPPSEECHIYFRAEPFDKVDDEAHFVARAAAHYIKRYPDHAVAVLCPAAWQGAKVVEEFKRLPNVPYEDLLRTTPEARNVARLLAAACRYVGDPTQSRPLVALFRELAAAGFWGEVPTGQVRTLSAVLRSVAFPEFFFPKATLTLSERLPENVSLSPGDEALLGRFTDLVSRWLRASELPVDQMLLAIGQDLFGERDEDLGALAICHTLALRMRTLAQIHPEMRLIEYAGELEAIAQNRRTLQELALPDAAYLTKAGVIVVTTMHKAKGLEWDAVYLMCVDSLEFPATVDDPSRDEPYYMPGRAPALEARKHLERAAEEAFYAGESADVIAQGRLETIAERLRLLYVAITRARRNLAFTWSRHNGSRSVGPALALEVLRSWAEALSPEEELWP